MSEAQAPEAAAPACPVALSALPANFQKHVDPKAPAPLRMMGAKALVPMGPKEMATALYMLTFDPDVAVRDTAVKSAASLPDRILSVALRDETVEPPVLDHYAEVFGAKDEYLEMLVLNASTPDSAVQRITARASEPAAHAAPRRHRSRAGHQSGHAAEHRRQRLRLLCSFRPLARRPPRLPRGAAPHPRRHRAGRGAGEESRRAAARRRGPGRSGAGTDGRHRAGRRGEEHRSGQRGGTGPGAEEALHHAADDETERGQEDRVGEQERKPGGAHDPAARPEQAGPAGGDPVVAHHRGRDRQGRPFPHGAAGSTAIYLQ